MVAEADRVVTRLTPAFTVCGGWSGQSAGLAGGAEWCSRAARSSR
ncbi:hypothetical protein [Pseudonocardia sp.]